MHARQLGQAPHAWGSATRFPLKLALAAFVLLGCGGDPPSQSESGTDRESNAESESGADPQQSDDSNSADADKPSPTPDSTESCASPEPGWSCVTGQVGGCCDDWLHSPICEQGAWVCGWPEHGGNRMIPETRCGSCPDPNGP